MGRWKNSEATFEIKNPQLIRGIHILFVDEVITTGARLEACARVLQNISDIRVCICCLAHPVLA